MVDLRKDVHLLKNLVTFQAASVSENFTKAAAELGVSRVAVSRQIAELEHALDTRLFKRNHRYVSLSREGEAFAKTINPALKSISEALAQMRADAPNARLTITVTTAFATYWLMPRLIDFGARHPAIEVNLLASDRNLDVVSEGIDVAIRYSPTPPSGPGWEPVLQETIFPVYSPSYQARTDLTSAQDLRSEKLLFLSGPYRPEAGWPHWFQTQGLEPPEAGSGIHMNTYINMLQAAIEGQGIALAGHPLVDSLLKSGELSKVETVPPLLRERYYIYISPESPLAQTFRSWVTEQIDT